MLIIITTCNTMLMITRVRHEAHYLPDCVALLCKFSSRLGLCTRNTTLSIARTVRYCLLYDAHVQNNALHIARTTRYS